MRVHNRMDFASGSFLLILGLFLAWLSLRLTVWSRLGPEAGFFPLIIALLIMGCSLVVLAGSFGSGSGEQQKKKSAQSPGSRAAGFSGPAFYVLFMLACGFFLESLGFLFASALLIVGILKYLEKQTWKMTLVLGCISIIASYVLFKHLLGVPLPAGRLLPW